MRSNIDNFDETFDWEIFDLYTNCVICCCVRMFFFFVVVALVSSVPLQQRECHFVGLSGRFTSITLRIYIYTQ